MSFIGIVLFIVALCAVLFVGGIICESGLFDDIADSASFFLRKSLGLLITVIMLPAWCVMRIFR